ncbi:IclR family transcriptional regulator [Planctopirus hydrillae]|uniref:IclR family transcriptional regulator n=1 Tax=Planctopirus hydrillae TaxID=1841610 RepID=A0A1C3EFC2_9PLAN|nr:IclR family transcriptional regulator [Planctopirus hydrillae]ODA31938.1 hypothetical protein A6X21_21960 [Planctopirus hydrillae]
MSKNDNDSTNPLFRYKVPILDRALDLLETLSKHPEGVTLTSLTASLGMPKNSVFRILSTLTLRGYVDRDEEAKVYRLNRKLLSISYGAIGGQRLLEVASPILRALRDATGETALLGTVSGRQGVVLDQFPSSHPVKVVVEIGHAFPLHSAAPAKAILAFLPESLQAPLISSITWTRYTPNTLTTIKAYKAELATVRQQGFAVDRCEQSEAYACVAAPIFDSSKQVIAAIWISGPCDRLPLTQLASAGLIVRKYALKLSRNMGFPDDSEHSSD